MSESVKIPVSYGINNHTYAEVTPDLARQIEALARDASEEQQFPPEARIAPSKRCVELENAALRARVEAAERRADEMEGKAGEWIAADVHKQRVQAAVGPLSVAVKALTAERDHALARVAELEATRIAYASEFDGDVGNIHASIKALKADLALANEDCREKQTAIEKFLSGEHAADAEIARLKADLAVLKRKYNES